MARRQAGYPEEFRQEAVRLLLEGRSTGELAASLGVSEQTLRNWRRRAQLGLRGQRGPRARDGEDSRARIVAAATVEFGAKGYRGASIGAIARRAGISQSGLLHHFPSKEILLAAVIEGRDAAHMAEYLAAKAEDRELGFMTGMVRLMRLGVRDPQLTRLFMTLMSESGSPAHPAHDWTVGRYRRTNAVVAEDLREAQERGLVRGDVDTGELAATLLAVMDGLQVRWLITPGDVRIDEAFAALAGHLLESVAADNQSARAAVRAWRRRHARG
jgi:AcrR family transcriptional regulator